MSEPNLDLIRMVQQARLAHDRDARPSQLNAVYWIEIKRAECADAPDAAPTERAGAWIISVNVETVDGAWERVRAATMAGALGYKSKVATAARSGGSRDRELRVLTYDADDTADVERVRAALLALGLAPTAYERNSG
jgi:hypothetical protein